MSSRSDTRTEKPTPRRLRRARSEGQIAKSKEVGVAASLAAGVLALRFLAPSAAASITDNTTAIFASADSGLGAALASRTTGMMLAGMIPFLAVAAVAGVAGGVAQVGFTLAPKAARPKLSHLSIKKGIQRFKPSTILWELGRSVLKLGLLAVIIWAPLIAFIPRLAAPIGLLHALELTWSQIGTLMTRAAILAVLIAAADYSVVRYRNSKQLKMSRQEVKEDLKETEGDPLTKAQRRRRQQEISRNRMIADVATADVVLTNPTRLAVALRYGAGYPAPQVAAKGAGRVAARIRSEAYRNGIPVMEDKPLARALFRKVRVGRYVPATLFEAVAVVLATAYRRRGRRLAA